MSHRRGLGRVHEAAARVVRAGIGAGLLVTEGAVTNRAVAGRAPRQARTHAVAVVRKSDMIVAPVEDRCTISGTQWADGRTGVTTAPGRECAERADAGARQAVVPMMERIESACARTPQTHLVDRERAGNQTGAEDGREEAGQFPERRLGWPEHFGVRVHVWAGEQAYRRHRTHRARG